MTRLRPRSAFATLIGALFVTLAAASPLRAYPEHLIRVIVTFPPGGSADIVIRALEPIIAKDLKQGFVVENRAGAGGNIGLAVVAKAAPDGYTLGVAPAGALTVNPHIYHNMPFDPLKDFAPITLLAKIPFVLVASKGVPVKNLADTIALAKSKPGQLAIGYGGNATAMHLTSLLFAQKAQVRMNMIPYRGTAPATTDVLAGNIQFAVLDIPTSQQLIREGSLKALGVSSINRVPFLPDVPTFAESGLADFDSVGWFGLVAPAGTPKDIIERLNVAFVKALKNPNVIEKIRVLGAEPAPMSPDMFAQFIDRENVRSGKLVAEMGLKSE